MTPARRTLGDLAARNPWWIGSAGFGQDPTLQRLAAAPFQRTPAILQSFRLDQPNVYTLRGPRQVGKSTLLKQLARRLIEDERVDPRRVVYYPLDLVTGPAEIRGLVERTKAAYPAGHGLRWYFLFDEVSSVRDWQRGIKYLRDNTSAADDLFVLTGSSSLDIRRGGERLPGRRGPGTDLDKLLLPLSFAEFLQAAGLAVGAPPRLSLSEILASPDAISDRLLYLDELERALEHYALVGGFPHAVADFIRTGDVSSTTASIVWDIVAGDVERWGRNRLETLRLLGRLVRSLGAPLDWRSLADDMAVVPATAQSYAELLADSFLLLLLYFREQSGATAPRKGKKLYGIDPLILQIPNAIEGTAAPGLPAIVENIVATALFHAVESDPIESFRAPQSLSFWRSSNDREIDFLAGKRPDQIPVEVKYQNRVGPGDTLSIRNAFGRGIVLSRHDLQLDGPVPIIPAAVFLSLL